MRARILKAVVVGLFMGAACTLMACGGQLRTDSAGYGTYYHPLGHDGG